MGVRRRNRHPPRTHVYTFAHAHTHARARALNAPDIPRAQALPRGSKLVSLEKELTWCLTAKRFVWQASQGAGAREGREEALKDKVRPRRLCAGCRCFARSKPGTPAREAGAACERGWGWL